MRCAHNLLRRPLVAGRLPLSSLPPLARFSHRMHTSTQATHTAHCAPYPSRTHTCGALTAEHAGQRVVLTGWLLPERKVSKSMSFFPLRDAYGTTQLVVHNLTAKDDGSRGQEDGTPPVHERLSGTPVESTILVEGQVRVRPAKQKRPEPAGEIEVVVDRCTLLNPADRGMPFVPSDVSNVPNEDIRARYRYLDLRRPALAANIRKRSKVAHVVRTVLNECDFLEVETPILLKSTPEGAREFLVPTRLTAPAAPDGGVHAPLFYALPQSPQQPKQLLVCSGAADRYYQLARCFRDEDGRKDRQPEFTQIDLEMAFVSWGTPPAVGMVRGQTPSAALRVRPAWRQRDPTASAEWRIGGTEVRDVVEDLIRRIWSDVEGVELPPRFHVLTYDEAMSRFGSDKPDMRFGIEINQVAGVNPGTLAVHDGKVLEFMAIRRDRDSAFFRAAQQCLAVPTSDIVRDVIGFEVSDNASAAPAIAAFGFVGSDIDVQSTAGLKAHLGVSEGDMVWMSSRPYPAEGGSTPLGRLRLKIAELSQSLGEYIPPATPRFLWVTEFPLFTRADEDKAALARGRWSSSHHPFTAPMWEDVEPMMRGDVARARGQHYDLVLDGVEVGGGSVRVHDAAMQEYIFSDILQLDESEKARFAHLLHALKCGAPPHGGIALGFDRLMAILCKTQSIRDVIAFPKTGTGTDLLFKSPAPASAEALKEYNIEALPRRA